MRSITFVLFLFLCTLCSAQKPISNFKLKPIPKELSWVNQPLTWGHTDDSLTITGGKGSNYFIDPQRLREEGTAPIALFEPDETFLFSCKLKVGFASMYDAGVLMVYGNARQWAKLCFEYSPQLQPMLVTVVTDELSDDSNHAIMSNNEVYVRIAGLGKGAYAFHYSLDGKYWNMLRYFNLDPGNRPRVGFLSQSPRGDACETVFTEINYSTQKLDNIRNGN